MIRDVSGGPQLEPHDAERCQSHHCCFSSLGHFGFVKVGLFSVRPMTVTGKLRSPIGRLSQLTNSRSELFPVTVMSRSLKSSNGNAPFRNVATLLEVAATFPWIS